MRDICSSIGSSDSMLRSRDCFMIRWIFSAISPKVMRRNDLLARVCYSGGRISRPARRYCQIASNC
jgi:hypothetical protein